ncbi:cyclic nucleotide-gated cation channel beta-3 isoform X3, partial [Biomphalaria glabrata]
MICQWLTKLWPTTTRRQRTTQQRKKPAKRTKTVLQFFTRSLISRPSSLRGVIAFRRAFRSRFHIGSRSSCRRSKENLAANPALRFGDWQTMERQRSHKRSSFRMRISRRMRAEFTPVPQHESDSDPGRDVRETEAALKKKDGGETRKDGQKQKEDHGAKRDSGQDNKLTVGQSHSHHEKECRYDNFTDLNVELQEDIIGFNFRRKRRSFGSESEKRRGERFQRREIEKRITLDESDGAEAESSSLDSHVCDVSCPLIPYGECPKSSKAKRKPKAPRRSSFTSSSSRESALNLAVGQSRRLKSLASLSIDDLPGVSSGEHGNATRSPGLHSTASMWSTSDLRFPAPAQKQEPDTISHIGTNSLSNVSGSLGDRMHELVRAFSGRTQRAKEKISQPPTPSSDSDYDAKS